MYGKTMPSAAMLIRIERTAYSKVGFTPDYSSLSSDADSANSTYDPLAIERGP